MSKILNYAALLLILVLFLFGLSFIKQPQTSNQKVLSATPAITSIITPNPNAKCHAKYLNSEDPQAVLPDPNCTPGELNLNVTQDNIYSTICKSGFTKTIRPLNSYTHNLKIQQIQEYGFTDTNLKDYEEDHLISLELGGDPSSVLNLWPEPHGSPNEKDKVENYLHAQICNGNITLQQAQKEISTNWYQIYLQIYK